MMKFVGSPGTDDGRNHWCPKGARQFTSTTGGGSVECWIVWPLQGQTQVLCPIGTQGVALGCLVRPLRGRLIRHTEGVKRASHRRGQPQASRFADETVARAGEVARDFARAEGRDVLDAVAPAVVNDPVSRTDVDEPFVALVGAPVRRSSVFVDRNDQPI